MVFFATAAPGKLVLGRRRGVVQTSGSLPRVTHVAAQAKVESNVIHRHLHCNRVATGVTALVTRRQNSAIARADVSDALGVTTNPHKPTMRGYIDARRSRVDLLWQARPRLPCWDATVRSSGFSTKCMPDCLIARQI